MVRRQAFTLIELAVLLAIFLVLLIVLVPAVQKVREAAAQARCANNLHQIGLAMQSYPDANRGLPPPSVFRDGVEIFWAPYDNRPGTSPTWSTRARLWTRSSPSTRSART